MSRFDRVKTLLDRSQGIDDIKIVNWHCYLICNTSTLFRLFGEMSTPDDHTLKRTRVRDVEIDSFTGKEIYDMAIRGRPVLRSFMDKRLNDRER